MLVSAMVEEGVIQPLIDAVYPLDEVVAAHKHLDPKPTQGKVMLK